MRLSVLHHLESAAGDPTARVYADVTEQVRTADALGYDTAWVAEHHFSVGKGHAPEPLLLLVQLAAHTRRIRVGSAVLPAPFYHPLRLAEHVAMADVLTGGRLACGISSSAVPDEMRVFGAEQEGKHERLREALHFLSRAWLGESVETGRPDPERVTIVPRPVQPLKQMVWVAASSHGAAQVAGEMGYHLLLPSLRPVEASAAHVATYRAALEQAGHTVADRNIQLTVHLVLREDHDEAMRLAEPIIRFYYERYVASGAVQRIEDESLDAVMDRINFAAGGPEAVTERLLRLGQALDLTHVAFQSRLIGLSQAQILAGLELAATRVAPLAGPHPALPQFPPLSGARGH